MAVSETKEGETRSHRHAKESGKYSPTTKPCSCDLMHVSPTSPCPSMDATTSQYSHASTERRRECRHFPFLGHNSSWLGSGPFSFSVSWCIPLLLPRAILLWIQIPWTLLFAFACLLCLAIQQLDKSEHSACIVSDLDFVCIPLRNMKVHLLLLIRVFTCIYTR